MQNICQKSAFLRDFPDAIPSASPLENPRSPEEKIVPFDAKSDRNDENSPRASISHGQICGLILCPRRPPGSKCHTITETRLPVRTFTERATLHIVRLRFSWSGSRYWVAAIVRRIPRQRDYSPLHKGQNGPRSALSPTALVALAAPFGEDQCLSACGALYFEGRSYRN